MRNWKLLDKLSKSLRTEEMEELFAALSKSKFRSRFRLSERDRKYVSDKGMDQIRKHAEDFVRKRLAPASIPNDGKQTPMKGHPVFLAQHATACCCRGCLAKWHHIPQGRALTEQEQGYVVDVLMEWIRRQMEGYRSKETFTQLEFSFDNGDGDDGMRRGDKGGEDQ